MDNISLNHPTGFCIENTTRLLYIADTGNDRILVFDLEGRFVKVFHTSKKIKRPFDIVCSPGGSVYISQINNDKIEIFNNSGAHCGSYPLDSVEGELRPGRMAFDPNGNIIFGDRNSGNIFIINSHGRILGRYDYKDEESLLTGIGIGAKGEIVTLWAQGIPVRIFDEKGRISFSFGHHRQIDSGFSFPSSLAIDGDGRLWISDALRHKVKAFSTDGSYLFQINTQDLGFPIDLEFDRDGRMYILEKGEGRIQAFLIGSE